MPFSSSFPPVEVPDTDLWGLVFERKNKPFGDDKVLFTDGETGRTYTFAQVRDTAAAFGQALRTQWHWQKGDVLAFFTANSVDTPALTMGALWAGGVASPANPQYTVDELAFQLQTARARGVVTQPGPPLKMACEAARRAGIPENRIVLLGDKQEGEAGRRFTHLSDLCSSSSSDTAQPARTRLDPPKDLAFVVFSSGTTGLPKGVCLSHRNLVANVLQFEQLDGRSFLCWGGPDGQGDRQLGVVPFFHIYGLVCCVVAPLYEGWPVVVMARFDVERACRLIQDHRVTWAYVPPPVVLAFAKHPAIDQYDLSSLKLLHSAAAPLTRELAEALWARLRIPVKQGFGLSETSPVTHSQAWDEWARYMGSVGKLAPNMEAKIADDAGNEVAAGEPGELWLRGPNVFVGYLNQPDLTRAAFSPCGFLKTGDVFRRDAHGNYYCVDRVKELVKYKGFQVPPAELEGLLVSRDDVADACVVGVHDATRATELPRAYVALRPGVAGDEAKARELADWVAAKVAPHKRLRGGVLFVDQVPRSASGKILRRLMRDQARQEQRETGAKL